MVDRIRVLLVDDQPAFVELAKSFLKREDDRFDIDTETSAATALERLDAAEYDCIVSDYDMPEINGLEFFAAVRERGIDHPFIVFSGVDPEQIDEESLFSAVTAYLQKGGSETFQHLVERIRLAVNEYRAGRELIDIEHRYDALFEHTSLAIAWVSRNGAEPVVADCNARFHEEFDPDGEEVVGKSLADVLDDARIDPDRIQRSIADGTPTTIEDTGPGRGDARRYEWRIIPVSDPADEAVSHGLIAASEVTDRTTSEAQLELYRTIVEASGDPMYVLDLDGRCTYVNDAMVELSGYDRDELLGKRAGFLTSEEDYHRGTDLIKTLLGGGRDSGTFEMELHTAAGETVPCENRVTLIYDVETGDGGTVIGTAGVLRDITDRKRRMNELRRHNDRLEDLAAFISHDLRNPINTAAGHLELAASGSDAAEYEAISRSLARMEELVDDLLVMARAGQTVTEPAPVALWDVARLAWAQISGKDARLTIASDRVFMGEVSMVRRLLENLFSNAIEHAGPRVTVTVGATEDGFFVEDDGPGIPPVQREDVFGYGYTTSPDGTGFGLTIVKQIVEAHGWAISIVAGSAGGTRFEVSGVEVVE